MYAMTYESFGTNVNLNSVHDVKNPHQTFSPIQKETIQVHIIYSVLTILELFNQICIPCVHFASCSSRKIFCLHAKKKI